MAWVRIHDGALTHPKLVGFIDWRNPFDVWVWGLSYVQMHLTDGTIVKAALPNAQATKTAAKLVSAGLWHDKGDAFEVHDYLEWNDGRARIMAGRAQTRKRLARWREKRDQNADSNAVTNDVRNGQPVRVSNDAHTTPRHATEQRS